MFLAPLDKSSAGAIRRKSGMLWLAAGQRGATQNSKSKRALSCETCALSDAMKSLTEQYYKAIVTQLHLSDQQLQLAPGNIAVDKTTQNIWAMMDSIPPKSVVNNWTPGVVNTFSIRCAHLAVGRA